jgi:hypothetical protein
MSVFPRADLTPQPSPASGKGSAFSLRRKMARSATLGA